MAATTNEIFCLYAHEDRAYIENFRKHLQQMEREGLISSWYDGLIAPGHIRRIEIEQHLNSANIIMLFISADFLNSDTCLKDTRRGLQRSYDKEALVIPVILRPCAWEDAPFAHLQPLPDFGRPVSKWRNRDEAFTQIVKHIRHLMSEKSGNRVPAMKCTFLNLPFNRNPIFTGRDAELEVLHVSLQHNKTTALVQAISGLGGIGKTESAVEYAYRYQGDYQRVLWLNAQSRETIVSDISKLTQELNTPGCGDQDQAIVQRGFLRWLAAQQNWLLVLDNVEDLGLIRKYLPEGGQGHVLLTTRKQAVGGEIQRVSIDEMAPEIGGYFLLKRAKEIAENVRMETIPAEKVELAKEVSIMLGGLPLALDQAGGFIERTGCGMRRYIQLYEQEHARLLAEYGDSEDVSEDKRKYKETVATTWSLSFKKVSEAKEVGAAAADLLRMCAFLASSKIPLVMFEVVATSYIGVAFLGINLAVVGAQSLLLERAIAVLRDYSLIQRGEYELAIHRLVQTVLRDAMSKEEWDLWAKRAVRLVNRVFPDPTRVEWWPDCRYILPHVLVCSQWIMEADIGTEAAGVLLNRAVHYLREQHSYEAAEILCNIMLKIDIQVLGGTHPDTLKSMNHMAALYILQKRYKEAEPLYKRVLEIRRRMLGEKHPDTAMSLQNLGYLYEVQKRTEEAERLLIQALGIMLELGLEDQVTARIVHNLAHIYAQREKYMDAEPLYKRAREIGHRVLGVGDPFMIANLYELGKLYVLQGHNDEAEFLYRQTLSVAINTLGKDHQCTKTIARDYSLLLQKESQAEENSLDKE